nr:methyl-accepting chemotaxis protein [uncultured Clostridium sp.]
MHFVKRITKQTNLLGLNAAIESARAGEYGKGFSVVSNEIRKLPQSTKESVYKINVILNSISKSVSEIKEKFNSSNNILIDQSKALENINLEIQNLSSDAESLKNFANID